MNSRFSENLKKIRKDHNLSQEQLADELGVSRQAISKWEQAVAYPEMDKIIALCDKFNVNIDDLLHKDIKEVKKEEESKKELNKYIEDILKFITDTVNLFSNMNFKSKIKCLFEQVIIILILALISTIIFSGILAPLFSNILSFLPSQINVFICNILNSLLILFCIVTSLIVLTHIFKTRYLDYYDKLKKDIVNDNNDNKQEIEINVDQKNKILFKKNENKIIIRDPRHSEYGFIHGLFKLIIGIIKFFALSFALLIGLVLICFSILLILSFLLYKTGIFFIGLLVSISASIVISMIILLVVLNFVFNRKNDKKKMITSFISALMIFGIGCGLILVGSLNFEILDANQKMLTSGQVELEMNKDILINAYNNDVTYIEEDIDNIRVEYKINKYCQLHLYQFNNNNIEMEARCSNFFPLLKQFIKNINNKKIIPFNNEIQDIMPQKKILISLKIIYKNIMIWKNAIMI